jgi:hypothetical protein
MTQLELNLTKRYALVVRSKTATAKKCLNKSPDHILDYVGPWDEAKERGTILMLKRIAQQKGLDLDILGTELSDWVPTKAEERSLRKQNMRMLSDQDRALEGYTYVP